MLNLSRLSSSAMPAVGVPTIAVSGSEARFPVRRIYCVGQNYAEHAREMGSDSSRKPPFFFGKPADAVVDSGARLVYPCRTAELHHEVELVLALGGGGFNVTLAEAPGLIYGWSVGLDLTRRDLQAEAKKLGRPWDMAKGFDASAPVGPLRRGVPPAEARIQLRIDGRVRQTGDVADMIWSVPEIIAELSTYLTLAPGDLIFTGTPAGVGPILRGETVTGSIDGVDSVEVSFDPS
jgi:fumarylpyruvate hydrolase